MRFDWNPDKERLNLAKHGVSFSEASTVFKDPLSSTISDPDHSVGEHRLLILGLSHRWRLLVVAHTDEGETIRIISARPAEPVERRQYERGTR
ncbi:MAG: BrnT family toxin [bacterium]|nr:BrnT family toxin [bacterium]